MTPPIKSTTCIEHLPPEMICELFEHLPPKDLVTCSLVNKRWHSIYAAFKLHTLAVNDFDPICKLRNWYGSNRPIQEAERCDPAMALRLIEKPLLSNLKHLALSGYWFKLDLNKLNRFSQLVHLEINTSLVGNVHLNLPKLRVLAFHRYNDCNALSIDCPQLSTLFYYIGDDELFEVKHPETIRSLETNLVDPEWLAQFKSVESLVTCQFEAISKATLLSLPELRELHYIEIIDVIKYMSTNEIDAVDRVKPTLNEFVDEAKKLRGSDFRFTFCGLSFKL